MLMTEEERICLLPEINLRSFSALLLPDLKLMKRVALLAHVPCLQPDERSPNADAASYRLLHFHPPISFPNFCCSGPPVWFVPHLLEWDFALDALTAVSRGRQRRR